MQYACVHEQHSLRHDMKTQKMKLNQVKEEDVNDERSEGHFTSETGRRAYVYLLMSSSDSSVSDQLSKPRHRVRASQLRVHLCVCEWKCVREDKKTRGQRERERETNLLLKETWTEKQTRRENGRDVGRVFVPNP